MSRLPPEEVPEVDAARRREERRRDRAWLLDLRGWLFVGMGLAGILTVALIVTADSSYAGIDGLRGIRALVPQHETDQPDIRRIPFLGGIISAIHDIAPVFFGSAPSGPSVASAAQASSRPASSPSSPARPTASPVPAAQLPSPTTAPPAFTAVPSTPPSASPSAPVSGPSSTQAPTVTPSAAPTTTPTPSPTSTPSPTPPPVFSITTDRGATAVVDLAGLVPGDSMTRTITVVNSGSLAFRYTASATQTASTLLWTDPTDGLQLTVSTSGGSVLYAGPLSGLGSLAGPTVLAPGAGELLRYTFDFPASASNAFQALVQDLTLVFDAVEFP